MHGSWDIEHHGQNFLRFGDIFCPFTHWQPKKTKFQKKKKKKKKEEKKPADIIILHMCAINDNPMMYCSWDKECKGHNFLSFWTIICCFIWNKVSAFFIEDEKLWQKCNNICNKVSTLIKKEFEGEPVYNKKLKKNSNR